MLINVYIAGFDFGGKNSASEGNNHRMATAGLYVEIRVQKKENSAKKNYNTRMMML